MSPMSLTTMSPKYFPQMMGSFEFLKWLLVLKYYDYFKNNINNIKIVVFFFFNYTL